jgi:hypothetical protein
VRHVHNPGHIHYNSSDNHLREDHVYNHVINHETGHSLGMSDPGDCSYDSVMHSEAYGCDDDYSYPTLSDRASVITAAQGYD